MIHAPRKCPITLHQKMECLGVIIHVDKPTDWVSSITYVQKVNCELCLCLDPCDLKRPSAVITTRCPLWRKSPVSSNTLATSPSWMPTMDTSQLFLIRTPAFSQHSMVPLEDTIFCIFPLALSAPKTSFRRRWTRS